MSYGSENFIWEELECCDDLETLNELERYYIKLSDSLSFLKRVIIENMSY